jgi:hypothetical protein
VAVAALGGPGFDVVGGTTVRTTVARAGFA